MDHSITTENVNEVNFVSELFLGEEEEEKLFNGEEELFGREDEAELCTPSNNKTAAEEALNELLPADSKGRYLRAYNEFIKWKNFQKAHSFSETVIMGYLKYLSEEKQFTLLAILFSRILGSSS